MKAAHEEAGKILADIGDPDHEYSILIRINESGGYTLSESMKGEIASVGKEVMDLLATDYTIRGVAHLHRNDSVLSPSDIISSIGLGISISAWTSNLAGELFLPSIGRWSDSEVRLAQRAAGRLWAEKHNADTHRWKNTPERAFVNRPASAEKYFHSDTRFVYRALR